MLTPDELEHLADEAAPGPWEVVESSGDVFVGMLWNEKGWYDVDSSDLRMQEARLIALAPTLARQHAALLRWATDEVRDVLLTRRELHGYDCPGDPFCHACRVLAALDEIRNKP